MLLLLITIASLTVTTAAAVVVARMARERRELGADLRALRQEVRQLARTLTSTAGRTEAAAGVACADEVARGDDLDSSAIRRDDASAQGPRGSRTVH